MRERVSNSVREHRREAGLTQEDRARDIAVSRQTIISIERGRYVPSLPLALRLAAFCGCSVDEMFTIEEDR
jgi:putative transcriptional regulator